jgi:hypothetical protein
MKRERERILLIGLGDLGGFVLELLSRIPGICEIITADFDDDIGYRKVNSAIEGASYLNLYPHIEFYHCDLANVEETAKLIEKLNPLIVFNGTTLLSPLEISKITAEVMVTLSKEKRIFGPWTAVHLALIYKLMKAIEMSGINTYVINSSYPDVTNPSLDRVRLAPTVGIGNIDLIVPYIQKAASELLSVPMRDIHVELIAHHYHAYSWCRYGTGYDAPHYLKVYLRNEDVTQRLGGIKKFVSEILNRAARPEGYHGHLLSASSTVKNILAILNDSCELTHGAGPQGLEGGYPIRLSRKGAEVLPPKGMGINQAQEINLAAQKYDGIQEINDNGDVVLTEEAYVIFKETLRIDHKVIRLEDSFEQAMEIKAKLHELAKKYGNP